MIIQFYKKDVYGTPLLYMVESEATQHIKAITGHKTLSVSIKQHLEALGVDFEQVLPPAN